jgi:hypothetical protein
LHTGVPGKDTVFAIDLADPLILMLFGVAWLALTRIMPQLLARIALARLMPLVIS